MTIANLKTAVAKMTPGGSGEAVSLPIRITYGKPQRLVERHYPHGVSIGAMEPVKVKLPQRYEDSDGNLCLPYAGVVAALKTAGIEVEP